MTNHLAPFQLVSQQRHEIVKYVSYLFQTLQNINAGTAPFHTTITHPQWTHDPSNNDTNTTSCTIQNIPNDNFIIRSLTSHEINILTNECQCKCNNWSTIFIMFKTSKKILSDDDNKKMEHKDMSEFLLDQVTQCTFSGHAILGINTSKSSTKSSSIPPGIHSNTLISNSVIEGGATVYNNTIISQTYISSSAIVMNCGSISIPTSPASFQDYMEINLGPETGGGRPIHVTPESTMIDVCSSLSMSSHPSKNKVLTSSSSSSTESSTSTIPMNYNIILGNLHHSNEITNVYISINSTIHSCPSIIQTITYPQSTISNSQTKSVHLQWNTSISHHSYVTNTLLMECAHVGPTSVICDVVLGPDSHVSCGEVHCSLIGPNTNSHHQSLVISCLWPLGRGNVGYGSNIGSNHTGRLPDQECTVGEGIFWGLGSLIKFPVDLTGSPYSVIAAGVQLPPQSVSMPFSLIMSNTNNNNDGGNQSANEIVPGWLLQSSQYTVLRNEEKFRTRRKAKRHDFYCGWKIARPGIIDSCIIARDALIHASRVQHGSTSSGKMLSGEMTKEQSKTRIYTDSDVPALGMNLMTERGRKVGIQAYTDFIQRYALHGLLDEVQNCIEDVNNVSTSKISCRIEIRKRLESIVSKIVLQSNQQPQDILGSGSSSSITGKESIIPSWPQLPWEESPLSWHHRCPILYSEFIHNSSLSSSISESSSSNDISLIFNLMKKLVDLERKCAKQVLKSKRRDDIRGSEVIPGYANAHIAAEQDKVVIMAQNIANDVEKAVTEVTSTLDSVKGDTQSRL